MKLKMSNAVYDVMKEIALVWLPALGALYVGLAKIWNFPYPAEIAGTAALRHSPGCTDLLLLDRLQCRADFDHH